MQVPKLQRAAALRAQQKTLVLDGGHPGLHSSGGAVLERVRLERGFLVVGGDPVRDGGGVSAFLQ